MSKKLTGGSAFPQANHDAYGMGPGTIDGTQVFDVQGMTLRDWFAGQAIAAGWQVAMDFRPTDDSMSPEQYCAGQAYAIADAMLAERSK